MSVLVLRGDARLGAHSGSGHLSVHDLKIKSATRRRDLGMTHVRSEDLTPGDFAVLDQNWAEINAHLDAMIFIIREHRKLGCRNWYCASEEFSDVLAALEPHQAIQLLAGAIERLATPVAALEDQPSSGED